MMHRCSSSHVGPCSCGLLHPQTNSFSMLFSMPNHHYNTSYNHDMYSSVDCTLSLGTPSTRSTEDVDDSRRVRHDRRPSSSSSCMSDFCWDTFQSKNASPYATSSHSSKSNTSRGSNSSSNSNSFSSNDPLLARRCANCDTTSTPLWRNGPRGPKSLCNACGIRFKKEERRATAANANGRSGNESGSGMDQHYGYQSNSTWVQSQKMACLSPAANEFRFIEDNDRDSDTGIPFLSWRLNVTDRPGLVHDFTR